MSNEEAVTTEVTDTAVVPETETTDETAAAGSGEETTKDAQPKQDEAEEKTKAKSEDEKKEQLRAARIAEQLKREKKFRDERLAWEKQRDADRKQLEEERKQFSSNLEKLKATRASLDGFVKELKEDPIRVLEQYFGIGPEQYYHRVMNNGKPAPEEMTSRELAALKQQLEEERNWRSNWEKSQKEKEEEAKRQAEEHAKAQEEKARSEREAAAKAEFLDFVNQNKSKYSDLLLYPESVVLSQAKAYISELYETEGEEAVAALSFEDVADKLNASLGKWHEQVLSARSNKQAAAPAVSEQAVKPAVAEEPKVTGEAKPVAEDDVEAAVARKAAQKKAEKVRRGSVRTATTLSGEMATRTTAQTKTKDWDEVKKLLKQELGS